MGDTLFRDLLDDRLATNQNAAFVRRMQRAHRTSIRVRFMAVYLLRM